MAGTTKPETVVGILAMKWELPQLLLFFGEYQKKSGYLMEDRKTELHQTRSVWIFNNGLENGIREFDQSRNHSKQIGIISSRKFFDERFTNIGEKEEEGSLSLNEKHIDEMGEKLNSNCDLFLCIDDGSKHKGKQHKTAVQLFLRKSAVQQFRSNLATYLAENQGLYFSTYCNRFKREISSKKTLPKVNSKKLDLKG